MYPVLKTDVKLKASFDFCWIFAPVYQKDQPVTQFEAFILTLLNGEWDEDAVKSIVTDVYSSDPEVCSALVDKVLKDFGSCIEFSEKPVKVKTRYNPQDFLFNGSREINPNRRLETPNILALALTGNCNFRCIYCFNGSGAPKTGELTGEEWCDVIDQGLKMGVFQVYVSGGEPTVHPDIVMILRKLKSADVRFKLFTNGFRLTDEVCELLAGEEVQISLDSADNRIHKLLTCTDTLDTVIGNIKRLVNNGTRVSVKSVITKYNTEKIPELYYLCNDLGVESIALDKFDVSSCGRGETDLRVDDAEKQRLHTICSKLKQGKTKLFFGLTNDSWQSADDIMRCGAFKSAVLISAKGDFIGCEKMLDVPEMIIGNVREKTLAELWNSPKIKTFLENIQHPQDEKCRNCKTFAECRTGCFAIKHYFNIPTFGMDPRCRLMEA
jgi:pyrroloquinoline quinone biosynthesis protein E